MSKKQVLPTGIALAASVMLIGLIMRSPITTLPLMLSQISQELGVPSGQLGILTTIPLVMFLLISNFASKTIFHMKSGSIHHSTHSRLWWVQPRLVC